MKQLLMGLLIVTTLTGAGWGYLESSKRSRVARQLGEVSKELTAAKIALAGKEVQVSELENSLKDYTSQISSLKVDQTNTSKQLVEAKESARWNALRYETAIKENPKSKSDAAFWSQYNQAASQRIQQQAVWQSEQDRQRAIKERQDAINRRQQFEYQLKIDAGNTERLKADAAMKAAQAAEQAALNPQPGVFIQTIQQNRNR